MQKNANLSYTQNKRSKFFFYVNIDKTATKENKNKQNINTFQEKKKGNSYTYTDKTMIEIETIIWHIDKWQFFRVKKSMLRLNIKILQQVTRKKN